MSSVSPGLKKVPKKIPRKASQKTRNYFSSSESRSHIAQGKYNKASVHLIRWKDEGDLVCRGEVDELEQTFWTRFRLASTQFLIPSGDEAQKETEQYMVGITSNCGEKELLIVYYAGHGADKNGFKLQQSVFSSSAYNIIAKRLH